MCLRSLEVINYHILISLSIIITFLVHFIKARVLQCVLNQYWPKNCFSFSLLSASTNNRAFFNVSPKQINNNTNKFLHIKYLPTFFCCFNEKILHHHIFLIPNIFSISITFSSCHVCPTYSTHLKIPSIIFH